MGKKVEVSYNPQLGYLQTIFHHNFDFLTGIKSYTERTDGVEFVVDTYKENTVKVFIQCVGEAAFRFRMYTPGNEHPFDNSIYQLEGQNGVNITENEEFISISKGKIEARVRKYPWEVSYYLDGKLKTKEQIKDSNVDNMCKNLPVGFTYDENKEIIGVNETMYLYADEEFYGFGEKFTDFGKRGQTINCWQTDALSTNTEKSYKNHPFFMSSRGYAILLNTYTRSKFEMGSFSNVAYNMSVEDKVLDYVIWMGNDYKALLKSYINQTGKIPMIPKWALGLWMSKCSYQTQDEIYEVVKISKERDIKIDVIHIDGWQKEGDAGAWVWDYERFPNPEEMIYKLKKEGIHLCLWIFPYIDENSKYFKEAEEKGFLVKNTKGVTSRFYSTATSTSKVGCFDFTNPHFIEWYKPKVRSVVSMGIGAVKTDFSEAVPEDAVYFDGSTGIQGHNKLTFLYAKTIYDIMAEVKIPLGELPMLWGRSGYAGSHTIPAAWAGDSSTHLNNHACILSYFYMANLDSVTKKAAQMAKQKGSKIFMDADSYTDELLDAISWIDIFIGSEFVYEKMLEAGKSVKENCEYLYNKGPEIVIFTFGEKGCAGISKEGFFEIPAFDVDVKDTVGAGDVFHGAFLAAIVKGLSPKDAARFASGVAAIKCTRIGGRAGIPNWEVTDNFLETGEIDYREIDERVKKYGRGIEYV